MGGMLFADSKLVSRIERAERAILTEVASVAKRRRPESAPFIQPISGGVAAFIAPQSPFNKVAGLGFDGGVEVDLLGRVEREFQERGAAVKVELSSLADPSIGELLTRRGYRYVGAENVLGRSLGPQAPLNSGRPCEATIDDSPLEDLSTWIDVLVTGFAEPDAQGVPSHEEFPREGLTRDIGDFAHLSGFQRYLATREGRPAGAASMCLFEGVVQLCGAATLPADRRRGIQSALLDHRLAAAREAGGDVAIVTTQPGSKSQQNVQRKGFELLYTRAVLVLEP